MLLKIIVSIGLLVMVDCIWAECPLDERPRFVFVGNTNNVGDTVDIRCKAGFGSENQLTATCQNNGKWKLSGICQPIELTTTNSPPSPVQCQASGINGKYQIKVGNGMAIGSVIQYQCVPYYEMRENNGTVKKMGTAVCQRNGQWSFQYECIPSPPAGIFHEPQYVSTTQPTFTSAEVTGIVIGAIVTVLIFILLITYSLLNANYC